MTKSTEATNFIFFEFFRNRRISERDLSLRSGMQRRVRICEDANQIKPERPSREPPCKEISRIFSGCALTVQAEAASLSAFRPTLFGEFRGKLALIAAPVLDSS